MKDEFSHSDKIIAEKLSMDETQVFLISKSFGLK